MRESVWYLGVALLFALYLTWRITRSLRQTMYARDTDDDRHDQN